MNAPGGTGRRGALLALAVLAGLAWMGLLDVLTRGAQLAALEAVQTVGLWCLFGLPLVVLAGLAGAVLPAGRLRTFGVWLGWQVGILAALQLGWLALPLAAALSIGNVVLASGCCAAAGGAATSLWLTPALALAAAVLPASWRQAALSPWLALLVGASLVLIQRCCHKRRWQGVAGAVGTVLLAGLLVPAYQTSTAGGAAESASPSPQPHVVMIVLDTQRADHLGCYGDDRGLTPNLDRFAAESTVFEQAYATASWTVPSHASLFTGLYPTTHGCSFEHHRWLDGEFVTLAERLAEGGYETAAFSSNLYLSIANLDQGFATFAEPGSRFGSLRLRRLAQLAGGPPKWADHGAADAVESVTRFLDERSDATQPLFLFVNLLEPHWRYLPAWSDRREHLPEGVNVAEATRIATHAYGPLLMAGQQLAGPVEPVVRGLYAAAVQYQDRQLGRLFEVLDRHLEATSTLLVVTADHGENLGEAGRWDHVFAVNDYLTRVPLLVRYPGVFPAGKREGGLVQIIDIPATVTELAGDLPALPQQAGRSLVPGNYRPRDFVLLEGDPYLGHLERMASVTGMQRDVAEYAAFLKAIRTPAHKLVQSSRGASALHVLADDPHEEHDRTADQPDIARELADRLAAVLAALPAYVPRELDEHDRMTPEELQRLHDLGYN